MKSYNFGKTGQAILIGLLLAHSCILLTHQKVAASPAREITERLGSTFSSKGQCDPVKGLLKCRNKRFSGDWTRVNFTKADLRGAVFTEGSKFFAANFTKANLQGADFRSSRQRSAPIGDDFDPNYSVCRSTCPTPVDLRSANFSGADLSGVKFGGALLAGARFNDANLLRTGFGPVGSQDFLDLRRTSFQNANMEGVTFSQVILSEVNFTNARLSRSYFLQVNLMLTNFEGAMLERATFIDSFIERTNFRNANTSRMSLPDGCKKRNGPTTCG